MAMNTPPAGAQEQADASSKGSPSGWETDYRWLVAWLVLLLVLAAAARTPVGRVVIYYALALMLLFLTVTQFRFFADALAPFRNLGPGLTDEAPQRG